MATATIPATSQTTFNERALALASAKHLTWRVTRLHQWGCDSYGAPIRVIIRVMSQTQPDVEYDVVYTLATDMVSCPCHAGKWGRPCCHAGKGVEYGRYVKALYAPIIQVEQARAEQARAAHEHYDSMMVGCW